MQLAHVKLTVNSDKVSHTFFERLSSLTRNWVSEWERQSINKIIKNNIFYMDITDRIFFPGDCKTLSWTHANRSCAMKKRERKEIMESFNFGRNWIFNLCSYMNALDNHQVRFNARNEINAKRNLTQRLSLLHLKLRKIARQQFDLRFLKFSGQGS